MEKKILLLIFVFNSILLFSQTNEYLRDDFTSNKFNWKLEDSKTFSSKIESGNLIIENNSAETQTVRFVQDLFMYNDSDFVIEAKIRFLSENENQTGGLIWHSLDEDNGFYFEISNEAKVRVWANKNGGVFNLFPWKEFPQMKGKEWFTLKIDRKRNDMNLFVNDVLVYPSGYRGQFAYQLGFVVGMNSKIAIDYLLVKHPPVDISNPLTANKIKKDDLFWKLNKKEAFKATVFGKVIDKATNKLLKNAKLTLKNSAGELLLVKNTAFAEGEFEFVFTEKGKYSLSAKAKDYISESVILDFSSAKAKTKINQTIELQPIEIGKAINLKNVLFERGAAVLLRSSYPELDKLAEFMLDNPKIEIELSGHTDNWGNANLNLQLSEKRVQTVKNYLVEKGISKTRISGKGYGGTKPIADNNNELTRKLNRRVEFKITKK